MTTDKTKRRPRRIAADEAHAWARSLRLNNPNAKSVLRALALYVNGDGECFVGLDQLSEDTDLSADTVRRRLVWLEQIGAIIRKAQWMDGKGIRNGEGRGKRTTDLVRLLIDVDASAIEQRAAGSDDETVCPSPEQGQTDEISPSQQQGQQIENETVSPRLAPVQPLQCCEVLDSSNHEPESPPSPPPGGEGEEQGEDLSIKEPEHFASFWSAYPGHEVMSRFRALELFAAMTLVEQEHARAAAPLLAASLKELKRRPRDAHKWLAEKGWREYPNAVLQKAAFHTQLFDPHSREGRAIVALHKVARIFSFEGQKQIRYPLDITPEILAFADVKDPRSLWITEANQIAAWSRFVTKYVRVPRPNIIDTRGIGENEQRGIWAPHPWPPKVDGTWPTAGPLASSLRDEDFEHFR